MSTTTKVIMRSLPARSDVYSRRAHKCRVVCTYERFEDTKGEIRIRTSEKHRQYNDQKKRGKRTYNGPHTTTQKNKYLATRVSTRNWNENMYFEMFITGDTRLDSHVKSPVISHIQW